jgi:hypothetical protein
VDEEDEAAQKRRQQSIRNAEGEDTPPPLWMHSCCMRHQAIWCAPFTGRFAGVGTIRWTCFRLLSGHNHVQDFTSVPRLGAVE